MSVAQVVYLAVLTWIIVGGAVLGAMYGLEWALLPAGSVFLTYFVFVVIMALAIAYQDLGNKS